MKKIASILAFLGVFSVAKAQSTQTLRVAAAEDTLTNVDTAYLLATISGIYDLNFKLTITKISGTVGGTALLQGSPDNSNWFTINSTAQDFAASQFQSSATVTNGTADYWWNVPATNHVYRYYRIRVITSGTQSCAPTGTAYLHPRN